MRDQKTATRKSDIVETPDGAAETTPDVIEGSTVDWNTDDITNLSVFKQRYSGTVHFYCIRVYLFTLFVGDCERDRHVWNRG